MKCILLDNVSSDESARATAETALTHFSTPDESKLDTDTSNLTITIRSYCGGVSGVADSACLPIE